MVAEIVILKNGFFLGDRGEVKSIICRVRFAYGGERRGSLKVRRPIRSGVERAIEPDRVRIFKPKRGRDGKI